MKRLSELCWHIETDDERVRSVAFDSATNSIPSSADHLRLVSHGTTTPASVNTIASTTVPT
jgi:hypothetical protein